MKTKLIPLFLITFTALTIRAQVLPAPPATIEPLSVHTGLEKDAHHRAWANAIAVINHQGRVVTRTNTYIELETGMHYWADGQWQETREIFESYPNGAIARQGPHRVILANNPNTAGAIDMQTPDGKRLRSHVIGLSYFDSSTGESVLIAEVKDSLGLLLPPNQIIYTNAFTDVNADLRYTYRKAGFEQDVILRVQPPSPAAFGLNPASTRLQILTEFLDPPVPQKRQMHVRGSPELRDEMLDFGAMKIRHGKAFGMGVENEAGRAVRVLKQWAVLEGRTFLVEEVPFAAVESQLLSLPVRTAAIRAKPQTGKGENVITALGNNLPRLAAHRSSGAVLIARLNPDPQPGFVLDYQILGAATDFTFKGDTTYYCTNAVYLDGVTKIEGGAVVKFSTNVAATVHCWDVVDCQTAPYRPAVFTVKDDNTVGEAITGSTGNPATRPHISTALILYGVTNPLHHLRFAHQFTALENSFVENQHHDLQFVRCRSAVVNEESTLRFQNCLFHDIAICFQSPGWLAGEHLTFNRCGQLFEDLIGGYDSSLKLTNCLGVLVTNLGSNFTLTTNTCAIFTNDPGVFQALGAGAHYLKTNSPYRDAGTTNISPSLRTNLAALTTYPPLLLTNKETADATLSPQAGRDADTPDLGYHYNPLDYITYLYTVTNATLRVTNGTAIACYNTTGIWLQDNADIVSFGTPLSPNWFVRYQTVQEQPVALGGSNPASAISVNPYHYGSEAGNGDYRFTKFACPAAGGDHLYSTDPSWGYEILRVSDCEFWNGGISLGGGPSTTLGNNLFVRSTIVGFSGTSASSLSLSNNLVWGSASVFFFLTGASPSYAFNNAFDASIVVGYGLNNGYNGYINCSGSLDSSSGGDVTLTNFTYASGSLGDFYQLSTNLLNRGSTTANLVGLYHYTVQTNQVKETNSTVDIGFHYLATDGNGIPLDSDEDGLADLHEDGNGNGNVDSGETDWNNATDLGLKVWITRPGKGFQIP